MSFQKSNTQVAKETLQPDSTKSDSAVAGQTLTGKISDAASNTCQGPLDQAQSKATPESSKTLGQKFGDMSDNAASALTPEGNKTTGQRLTDSANPDKHDHSCSHGHHDHVETTGQKPGLVDQAKNAVNNVMGTNK